MSAVHSINTRSAAFLEGSARTPNTHNTSGDTTLNVPPSGGTGDPISYPIIPVVVQNTDKYGTGAVPDHNTRIIQVQTTPAVYQTFHILIPSLGNSDCGKWLRLNFGKTLLKSTWAFQIDKDVPTDMIIMGVQVGEAQIEFIPGYDTLTSQFIFPLSNIKVPEGAARRTRAKGAVFGMVCSGNNIWDLFGDLDDEAL